MNSLTSLFGNNVPKTKNGANVAVKNNKMINAPMKVVNAVVENVAVKNNKKNASINVANVVAESVAVKKNNASKNVANPVVENVAVNMNNASANMTTQEGGVASVKEFTPFNMRQPSENVMVWSTTAPPNAPTLSAAEMRTVGAHGGARKKTRKHKKALKYKKAKSHKKGKKGNKKAKKSLKRK